MVTKLKRSFIVEKFNKQKFASILVLTIWFQICISCSSNNNSESLMTKEEVLEIASEYAQKKGYDIKQYDISIEFDKNEWRIEYQGKEPG